jgi:ribosomal protein S18 acetylase RimI-like enzyme
MKAGCHDWRLLRVAEAVPLVEAEACRWAAELDWDVSDAWRHLEPARVSGRLAGLVYREPSGRVAGWCCYLVHQGTLQVAMLVADTREVTAALLTGVVNSPEASAARSHAICVRQAAPGLRQVLAAHGFGVTKYRYLAGPPSTPVELLPGVRSWRSSDVGAAPQLFSRAYPDAQEVRAFAVHGTPEEWRDYTDGLVTRLGCGRFLPEASFVVDVPSAAPRPRQLAESDDLDGAILTTDLGRGTAHVAQIAVDPIARGLGFGRTLMTAAMASAASRGFSRLTLLVAEANAPAARVYETLGFRDRATFVVALNRQPRRSKSVALATGGASTRR